MSEPSFPRHDLPGVASPPTARGDRFTRRVVIASVVALGAIAGALVLWYAIAAILAVFAAVLLAILFRGLADAVARITGLPHRGALAVVLVGLALALGLGAWLLAHPMAAQFNALAQALPESFAKLRGRVEAWPLGGPIAHALDELATAVTQGSWLGRATSLATRAVGAAATLLVIFFLGVYFAAQPSTYVGGALRLVPVGYRARAGETLGAVGYTLKWWMLGQGIAMLVIGTATSVGLWALGVPLALAFGVLAGLFNFIPNFGPLVSMIPATLVAFAHSPQTALYVVIFYVIVQNIEGNLLTPMVQKRAVELPEGVTLTAQLVLGVLAGAVGVALAAPLAAATLVAVKMLYVEDALGDRIPTPADGPGALEVREARQIAQEVSKDAGGSPTAPTRKPGGPFPGA